MEEKTFGIDGFTLKWIAMICMAIDHTGAVLFPQYLWLRMVGRLAFPIYCFLLAEGAVHTGDIYKYARRLFLFALLSDIPFDLALFGGITVWHQNVFFTLLFGLLAVIPFEEGKGMAGGFFPALLMMGLAQLLHTDYGAKGVALILLFYLLREHRLLKQAAFVAADYLAYGAGIQSYAGLAAVPMLFYNGKRGPSLKYFFYVFYPLHLLILYFILANR